MSEPSLTRYAWLSIATALATIGLKTLAWWLTDSVGLLSDALESGVNLAAAIIALWMLWLAAAPADDEHAHGHGKAEYFASAFEGGMILLAAVSIVWTAAHRLMAPQPIESVGLALGVSLGASLLNLGTALVLRRAARTHRSITLEADSHHLLTDVWTSGGVLVGVLLVSVTGWLWLDPVIAILVAVNILWTGWQLMRRSAQGLMDASLPESERAEVDRVLSRFRAAGTEFHAIRTRQAGRTAFVSMHVLVPGEWTVTRGHDLCEEIELALHEILPHAHTITHLEPIETRGRPTPV